MKVFGHGQGLTESERQNERRDRDSEQRDVELSSPSSVRLLVESKTTAEKAHAEDEERV